MDWLSCNRCFLICRDKEEGTSLWFLSCGHIFCSDCIKSDMPINEDGRSLQCIQCTKQASMVQIKRNMRSDLLEMFKPPIRFLYDAKKAIRIMEFQDVHRKRLIEGLQETQQRYAQLGQEMQQEFSRVVMSENALKEETNALSIELEEAKSRTEALERMLMEREKKLEVLRMEERRREEEEEERRRELEELRREEEGRIIASPVRRSPHRKKSTGHSPYERKSTGPSPKKVRNSLASILDGTGGTSINMQDSTFNAIGPFPDANRLSPIAPCLSPIAPRPDLNLQNLLNTPSLPSSSSEGADNGLGGMALAAPHQPYPYPSTSQLLGFNTTGPPRPPTPTKFRCNQVPRKYF